MLNFTEGSLIKGDTITFSRYYSRWRKLWFAIRYMRHNRPDLQPMRQFVVTSWSSYEAEVDET